MLNIIDHIPVQLLGLQATDLHKVLPGPTLVHLQGKRKRPMFISVLVHGNEHTGWEAVRQLLADFHSRELPRSISLFIGNVEAARYNKRFLQGQPDYNRIWDGGPSPEHKMMQLVIEELEKREVLLSIDIHNNTGKNPHYACVNRTYNRFIQLATLFSSIVVYFIRPAGVQSMAFSRICPAVTIECGKSGEPEGIDHVYQYLHTCLNMEELPDHAVDHSTYDLFHTIAVVKIPEDVTFGFQTGQVDLELYDFLERYNFNELPANTEIGRIHSDVKQPFFIRDEQGNEIYHQYFHVESGKILTRQGLIPSMITLDTDIIRKDCFFYVMEHCVKG